MHEPASELETDSQTDTCPSSDLCSTFRLMTRRCGSPAPISGTVTLVGRACPTGFDTVDESLPKAPSVGWVTWDSFSIYNRSVMHCIVYCLLDIYNTGLIRQLKHNSPCYLSAATELASTNSISTELCQVLFHHAVSRAYRRPSVVLI